MPKRTKYPRLRNGFGSIRYLGKKRTNPYAVLAPTTNLDEKGRPKYDKPLAYAPTWQSAFSVLLMYHSGKWNEESKVEELIPQVDSTALEKIVSDIMKKLDIYSESNKNDITFTEVYERYMQYKFNGKKEYSKSSIASRKAAFNNCFELHNKPFKSLKLIDLQNVVDNCKKKHASKELVVLLIKQMYQYAEIHELIEKDYSKHLTINSADDDEHGEPFTTEELGILWQNKDKLMAKILLIMCYSGFRINEYKSLEINLDELYFKGGSKTQAGKNRIVPIHSLIVGFVKEILREQDHIINVSADMFRIVMYRFLDSVEIKKHTPHDTRHTFSMLCDKYYVNENDKKRMLGHAFQDITNKVYGHRELESLRAEIEKIKF